MINLIFLSLNKPRICFVLKFLFFFQTDKKVEKRIRYIKGIASFGRRLLLLKYFLAYFSLSEGVFIDFRSIFNVHCDSYSAEKFGPCSVSPKGEPAISA